MIDTSRTPIDDLDRIGFELKALSDRIDRLAQPSGTSVYRAVEKLTALVEDIQAQLDDYINNHAYTKSQVDALIASPGNIAPGTVTASGAVSGTVGTFNGGLKSTDVHGHLLTYGGAYTATWCHVDGTLGTVPSSERYKRDFRAHGLDLTALDRAEVLAFRYIDAVDNLGEDAEYVLGGLAEQFVACGLGHTVVRNADGLPFSIEDRPLLYTLLAGYQQLSARVAALEGGA